MTPSPTLSIGKDSHNNLVLNLPGISRSHCQVQRLESGEFLVKDLDSTNGTFVNGQPIAQKRISPTDSLRLAQVPIDLGVLEHFCLMPTPPQGLDLTKAQAKIKADLERKRIREEFLALEQLYEDYKLDKKKALGKKTLKSTGIRAALALIPLVGNALGILASGTKLSQSEELEKIDEDFKAQFCCSKCHKFLGFEPFENHKARGFCLYCKTEWLKED